MILPRTESSGVNDEEVAHTIEKLRKLDGAWIQKLKITRGNTQPPEYPQERGYVVNDGHVYRLNLKVLTLGDTC